MTTEREQFELFWANRFGPGFTGTFYRDTFGENYQSIVVQRDWEVWQAALAAHEAQPLTDEQIIRIMVMQPMYGDDADYAHMIRMGRAIEAAVRGTK